MRSTLEKVPGVAKVDVDFDKKTATVQTTEGFDSQVALAKLTAQDQFKNTTLVK